jgi:hypothetical protein
VAHFEIHTVSLFHRSDDEKEFPSCSAAAYDGGMAVVPLLAALSLSLTPTYVSLTFAPDPRLATPLQRAAIAEAATIWSPYRVTIAASNGAATDLALTILVSCTGVGTTDWRGPLGAVEFDADGSPGRVVTVFLDRLLSLLDDARFSDVTPDRWPRALREQALGRAVGRVIAHEIGHVLLRTRDHTARGLMRAVQYARELIEPGRERYRLEP